MSDPERLNSADLAPPLAATLTCPECKREFHGIWYGHHVCTDCRARQVGETRRRDFWLATFRSIPPRFQWATFRHDDLRSRVNPPYVVDVAEKLTETALCVVLVGPSGSGKTSLACALLRRIGHLRSVPGQFVSSFRIAKARREHRLGDGDAPEIGEAMKAPLLLLDEVGAEYEKNTAMQELIHERHNLALPTLYTTGFSFTEIVDRYGDGIARRMFEDSTVLSLGERSQ